MGTHIANDADGNNPERPPRAIAQHFERHSRDPESCAELFRVSLRASARQFTGVP